MTTTAADITFNFEYRGRQAGKAAEQEAVLREHVGLGEHVHLLSRPATKCWNGNERCMVWLAQGGDDAEPYVTASRAEGAVTVGVVQSPVPAVPVAAEPDAIRPRATAQESPQRAGAVGRALPPRRGSCGWVSR